jgi:hypothetical protein
MRHPSIRGIGIRYVLALTLPISGVALVLYTVAQLFGFSFREHRTVSAVPATTTAAPASTIAGSTAAAPAGSPSYRGGP